MNDSMKKYFCAIVVAGLVAAVSLPAIAAQSIIDAEVTAVPPIESVASGNAGDTVSTAKMPHTAELSGRMLNDKSLCDSPARLISGMMSGVRVGEYNGDATSGLSVYIRGINSSRTDSQPLWIVDGMPLLNLDSSMLTVENQLSFVNPYDIESIEVLKDISAASIYGSMGANGVIIVNTMKKSTEDGLKINWNSAVGCDIPYFKANGFKAGISHNHSVGLSYSKGKSMLHVSAEFIRKSGAAVNNYGNTGNFSAMYETMVNPVVWFGTNTLYSIGKTSSPTLLEKTGSPSALIAARYVDMSAIGTVDGYLADFDNDAKKYRIVNSSYLVLNFLNCLNFKAEFGLDYHSVTRYVWYGLQTPLGSAENGYADICGQSGLRLFAAPSFNFDRLFGGHRLQVSMGSKIVFDNSRYNLMQGSDFFSHELRAKGLNIHSSKTVLDNYSIDYGTYSLFLKASYGYKDFAGVNLSLMPQWTPRYYDSMPQLYYGVDAYVNVYKGIKLSAGYGVAANESAVPYMAFGNYLPYYEKVDPSLEFYYEGLMRTSTKEWHTGIDLQLLDGRLSSSLNYYRKHSDDLFRTCCFGEKGDSYLWKWSGRTEVSNRSTSFTSFGVELDIDAVPVMTEGWKWTVGTSFTYSDNVVTAVSDDDRTMRNLGNGIATTANVVGKQIGSFVGYNVLEDGTIEDATGDGNISAADMKVLGSPVPKYHGALRSTLQFTDFRMEAVFDWAAGGQMANLNRQFSSESLSTVLLSTYVEKSDYFRMKNISLSYDFHFKRVKFIKTLGVSLTAYNIFTVSGYSGWNPLADCYGVYACHGVDYSSYQPQRTVMAGVKLLF